MKTYESSYSDLMLKQRMNLRTEVCFRSFLRTFSQTFVYSYCIVASKNSGTGAVSKSSITMKFLDAVVLKYCYTILPVFVQLLETFLEVTVYVLLQCSLLNHLNLRLHP
jgi:hypothetical protein